MRLVEGVMGGKYVLWREGIRRPLIVLVGFNFPFWLLSQWMFIDRPLLNLDGLLLILAIPLGRVLVTILLILLWLIDLTVVSSHIFHFRSAIDYLGAVHFLELINLSSFITYQVFAVFLLFLVCGILVVRQLIGRVIGGGVLFVLIAIMVLATTLDFINGSLGLSRGDIQLTPVNVSGSSLRLLVLQANGKKKSQIRALPEFENMYLKYRMNQWAHVYPDRGVLFIIDESLGYVQNKKMREWLSAQLIDNDLRNRYLVEITTSPFNGATTDAELRQLCGVIGSYSSITVSSGGGCLPSSFVVNGWNTIGIHGFSGGMFDRRDWWPLIGIQKMQFAEDRFYADGPKCGGAFRGVCDTDLINAAVALSSKPNNFVYYLTLNTHLPIEEQEIPGELRVMCEQAAVGAGPCQLVAAHGKFFAQLSDALKKSNTPPLILLVGDHAPPFSGAKDRLSFDSHSVPAYVLIPRAAKLSDGRHIGF